MVLGVAKTRQERLHDKKLYKLKIESFVKKSAKAKENFHSCWHMIGCRGNAQEVLGNLQILSLVPDWAQQSGNLQEALWQFVNFVMNMCHGGWTGHIMRVQAMLKQQLDTSTAEVMTDGQT